MWTHCVIQLTGAVTRLLKACNYLVLKKSSRWEHREPVGKQAIHYDAAGCDNLAGALSEALQSTPA